MARSSRWYADHRLGLDLFILVNLTFLGPDIYLAHSTNSFRSWAEYIPLAFSLIVVILSNLISNVPAVLLLKPLIPQLANPQAGWLTLAAISARDAVRFHTTSGKPALRRLCPMGRPIRPRPMRLTVGCCGKTASEDARVRWNAIEHCNAERAEQHGQNAQSQAQKGT